MAVPSEPPEEGVRAWVTDGEAAAESKDRGTLVDMISESYADGRGNTRKDIGSMFLFYFMRQENIAILTKIDSVEMHGDTAADVTLTVGLAGMNDSLFGLNADAFRFELELENDGDDWLLIGARWGELGRELRSECNEQHQEFHRISGCVVVVGLRDRRIVRQIAFD